MRKTTASLLLALLCMCGGAVAQSDSSEKCTDSDKRASKELAQSFFEKFRRDYDLEATSDEFVSSAARCGSLFNPDPFEIDTAIREQLGCVHIRHLQYGILNFFLLEIDYQMGSEGGILDDDDFFEGLPDDVKAVVKQNPFWAKMYEARDSGSGKISSINDFEMASSGIDQMNMLMRQYLATHPEYRQRALTRLQQLETKSEGTRPVHSIECAISDGEPFYNAPKGTSVIFTDLFPLPFQVVLIREDGRLKISSFVAED